MQKRKSFLERLTSNIRMQEEEQEDFDLQEEEQPKKKPIASSKNQKEEDLIVEEDLDAELTVDLYETANDIIIQTMVAGVQPDNLSITITRDSVTIKGRREENKSINKENYHVQELYWGSFSRTISLPEEIDPEEAEALEKHGLLMIKLPKIDKNKETKLKIKTA